MNDAENDGAIVDVHGNVVTMSNIHVNYIDRGIWRNIHLSRAIFLGWSNRSNSTVSSRLSCVLVQEVMTTCNWFSIHRLLGARFSTHDVLTNKQKINGSHTINTFIKGYKKTIQKITDENYFKEKIILLLNRRRKSCNVVCEKQDTALLLKCLHKKLRLFWGINFILHVD